MRSRPAPITSYFLSLVCMALFATSLASACSHSQRIDTLHTSVLTVKATWDGFTTWDLDHQRVIRDAATTREEAQANLASYRVRQTQVVAGFEVVWEALALAATQTDDLSLADAIQRTNDLIASVKDLKSQISGGK